MELLCRSVARRREPSGFGGGLGWLGGGMIWAILMASFGAVMMYAVASGVFWPFSEFGSIRSAKRALHAAQPVSTISMTLERALARWVNRPGPADATEPQVARRRLGPDVALRVHDIDQPLEWAPDGAFDIAVMAPFLPHLDQPNRGLQELNRVLTPGRWLVVSTVHPTFDWRNLGGSYFANEVTGEPGAEAGRCATTANPLMNGARTSSRSDS